MAIRPISSGKGKILKGVFYDSLVRGLEYETQTLSGITNEKGEFQYRPGETVTFSIGGLILGSALGSQWVTPADIVFEVAGDVKKIRDPRCTNIARFLQSLAKSGNVENGITITDGIRNTIKRYKYRINFNQSEVTFATIRSPGVSRDPNVAALFDELKLTLRTPAQARNHLRRTLHGIKKMTDVKIPMGDGSYVLADVFRPIKEGKYPVVMSFGSYGKAWKGGCICSTRDLLENEEAEDTYFEAMPGNSPSEHFETANTLDWVPEGYIVIRVDERGVCNSPGMYEQFSLQEAKDFYDTIEWIAKQPWCNGNVGTWGASYYSTTQFNVASLQPPSLKAMIPVCGGSFAYRDSVYSYGGIYNRFNFIPKNSCGEWQGKDWISLALKNPFEAPALYGPKGTICMSPDPDKIVVPFLTFQPTEARRGNIEAYILAASKDKKLYFASEPPTGGMHGAAYANDFMKDSKAFFDYWLKGVNNGVMDQPPVKMTVRTGWGGFYFQYENEWPIARTQYTKYYLDASPSPWEGDKKKRDFMTLSPIAPVKEMTATYSAEVNLALDPSWSHGVSFITDPMSEDIVIAGHTKLVTWVSSTSSDMDIFVSVRVMDENNQEVPYRIGEGAGGLPAPIAQGALKVSHRKLDPEKSTVYCPWHTHLKEDYQPLTPGEVVEGEVVILPTTARIRKGHRIRLDIQPAYGSGWGQMGFPHYDETYHKGAFNTIYTGPHHISYLQLPIIPPKL
jgi:predicted acyl esterase